YCFATAVASSRSSVIGAETPSGQTGTLSAGMPAVPAPPRWRFAGRIGLLARTLARDESGLVVGRPALDREPERPFLRKGRVRGCLERRLAGGSGVVPLLRRDVDRRARRLLAIEDLEGERHAGAADGRRVR